MVTSEEMPSFPAIWRPIKGLSWALSLALLGLLFILGTPTQALADEPSADERERAREHFERGAELFFEERYGAALVEFRRAHRLNPHPMILYNKSVAHLRLGNLSEAHRRAQDARDMGGLPQEQELQNLARIDGLAAALTARAVADDIAEAEGRVVDRDDDVEIIEPVEEKGLRWIGWSGIALTTFGALSLGFSGFTHLQLNDKIATYESTNWSGDPEGYWALRRDIESTSQRGRIAMYVGAAATAAGLTLLTVDLLTGGDDESGLVLRVGPAPKANSGAMLHLHRRF